MPFVLFGRAFPCHYHSFLLSFLFPVALYHSVISARSHLVIEQAVLEYPWLKLLANYAARLQRLKGGEKCPHPNCCGPSTV